MIIHLTVPAHKVHENMSHYAHLIDAIHAAGCSLARNWIQPAYQHAEDLKDELHRDEIVREVQAAITRADVVIADVSSYDTTGIGLQIAWALQQGKRVLALQDIEKPEGVLSSEISDPMYEYIQTDDFAGATTEFLKRIMRDK